MQTEPFAKTALGKPSKKTAGRPGRNAGKSSLRALALSEVEHRSSVFRNLILWRFERVAILCFLRVTAFLNTRVWRFNSAVLIGPDAEILSSACTCEAGNTLRAVACQVREKPCAETCWGL